MRSQFLHATATLLLSLGQAQQSQVRVLGQLAEGTFLENLALRSNGQMLMTELTAPRLWSFDTKGIDAPVISHEFSNYTSLSGITETTEDVFAVIAGSLTDLTKPGLSAVWKVDYTYTLTHNHTTPTVSKITDIPEVIVSNGMTYIPTANMLLIADSASGKVTSIILNTGTTQTAIDDPLMKPCPDTSLPSFGINGIRYHHRTSTVYWTNVGCGTLSKIGIDPMNASPRSPATLVGSTDQVLDDFALTEDGTAYIANNGGNSIIKMYPNGTWAMVAGGLNSTEILGPTSVQFARHSSSLSPEKHHKHLRETLYVSTAGRSLSPINGTVVVVGAQLLAIDIDVDIKYSTPFPS